MSASGPSGPLVYYSDDQMVFKERAQSSVPWSLKSAKQGTQKGIFQILGQQGGVPWGSALRQSLLINKMTLLLF